jgi:hypothetical protein
VQQASSSPPVVAAALHEFRPEPPLSSSQYRSPSQYHLERVLDRDSPPPERLRRPGSSLLGAPSAAPSSAPSSTDPLRVRVPVFGAAASLRASFVDTSTLASQSRLAAPLVGASVPPNVAIVVRTRDGKNVGGCSRFDAAVVASRASSSSVVEIHHMRPGHNAVSCGCFSVVVVLGWVARLASVAASVLWLVWP